MTILENLKAEYEKLLRTAHLENRGLTVDETKRADQFKAEIVEAERIEREANAVVVAGMTARATERTAAAQAAVNAEEQKRSAAAAASGLRQDLPSNEYYRSLAKGAVDVGNKEVVADVVRVYQSASPIFAAHTNVQTRSTGMTFTFTRIRPDLSKGYVKTEGASGRDDSTTTIEIVPVPFKLYDSESVLVTQELLDDATVDLGAEISSAGLAKSGTAFGADLVTALMSAVATPTETAATTWAISDLAGAYFGLPLRNRVGLRYIMNSQTAKAVVDLLGVEAGPRLAAIGLSAESILVDEAVTNDVIILANVALALAVGQKTPVRVLVVEVSAGRTYELQPRFAVALRDGTAVAVIKRKSAA